MAHLLVVDDEPGIRQVLADFLVARGHSVEQAGSGSQAIALLKGAAFAVVFLDLSMPGMDGLEVLRRIRAASPGTAAVMISGVTDQTLAAQAMDLGAFDFITKPFDLEYVDRVLALRLTRTS